jgi:hypothetical protein
MRVAATILAAGITLNTAVSAPDDITAGSWVEDNYAAVLDEVMPLDSPPPDPRTMTGRIAIRIVPSGLYEEEHETLLIIEQFGDAHVSMSVLRPTGKSVLSQVQRLKLEHPEWGTAAVAAGIRVERWTETVRRRSSLSFSIRKLVGVNIGLMPDVPIFVDPTTYSVHSWTPAAEMRMSVAGPGARSPRQPTAFLKIIEQLKQEVIDRRAKSRR